MATRKKRNACHPKVGRRNECLPIDGLYEIGNAHGAPRHLRNGALRKWLTRKTGCKTERCLLEKTPLNTNKKNELLSYFRPTMPDEWITNPDEWLDSNNINDVMKQYQQVYRHFKFFGTNPIDFAAPDPYDKDALMKKKCLNEEICNMNLKALSKQGKTMLGFVSIPSMGMFDFISSSMAFDPIPSGRTVR